MAMLGNDAETAQPQASAPSNSGGNGHAPAAAVPTPESDETTIGPLLARANLLRMRSQWDEAVATCTEALRRMPESPTACSLLGDIYEAQNKLDDALQWYGMAVDFDPTNKTDRAKLDRVVEIQRRALLQEERDAGQRARQAAPPRAADAAHRSLQWFDRVFPPGRAESMARLILVICGIIALLLGFATVFVFLGDREEAETPNIVMEAPPPPAPVVVPPRVPPSSPPAPSPGDAPLTDPGKVAGRPLTPSGASPAPTNDSPAPAASPAPVGDAALLYALGRGLPQDITVSAAQVDGAARQMTLALTLPAPTAGETPAALRERVLRAALTAVNVAAPSAPQMERAFLRVSMRPVGPGTPPPVLAFTGETAVAAARAVNPVTTDPAQLRGLFTNPWWAASLAP